MNNKAIAALVGLVAVAMIGGVLVMALRESAPQPSTGGNNTTESPAMDAGDHNGMQNSGGNAADSDDGTVRSGEVSVDIQGFAFQPASITVKKGTTVTWTNRDDARHDVTADDDSVAGAPQSELFGKGESYSFTFDTVGEFEYHCSPHPYMEAKVTVVE